MGKGKGNVEHFVSAIKKGNNIYEMKREVKYSQILDTENLYPKFLKKLRKEKEFRKGGFFARLRRSRRYEIADLQLNKFIFLIKKIQKVLYKTYFSLCPISNKY